MRLEAPLVLIVDDDEHIRDLLRTRLELNGLTTLCAGDGAEAMATLSSHRPAAMLLDVSMPRMDGFQLLEALRRTRRTPPPTCPTPLATAHHWAPYAANANEPSVTARGVRVQVPPPTPAVSTALFSPTSCRATFNFGAPRTSTSRWSANTLTWPRIHRAAFGVPDQSQLPR